MYQPTWNRRQFLEFMGRASASAVIGSALATPVLMATSKPAGKGKFKPLEPTNKDDLVLSSGFHYQVLISWGTKLNQRGDTFGFNNDYIAYLPIDEKKPLRGILWVNHESFDPVFLRTNVTPRSQEHVRQEMQAVGGSLVEIQKRGGRWTIVPKSRLSRRITAETKIPFAGGVLVAGSNVAMGTLANCAGGVTPWNTILTCEENYQDFYGETVWNETGEASLNRKPSVFGWHEFFPNNRPEHYGWVVEVDPRTGSAKKHTTLGRFAHECATTIKLKDGRTVVYSGDDSMNECLYKFVSSQANSLEHGELFVADITNNRWLSLDWQKQPSLQKKFKNQLDVLVRTREAAHLLGATALDRPEDVEIDPISGNVFVTLTNNESTGNLHGSILRLVPKGGDHSAVEFTSSTFITGGADSGFSSPDNMAFDRLGNLWLCTDVSGSKMNTKPYQFLGNNSLFYIPMSGPQAGKPVRVASAPVGAEFTGPWFAPDQETLFLSVQHPGERTKDLREPLSHWPEGGKKIPKPSVVAISGPMMKRLLQEGPLSIT